MIGTLWCSELFWRSSVMYLHHMTLFTSTYLTYDKHSNYSFKSIIENAVCKMSAILFMTQCMGLIPDTQNCGLRMRRECRERLAGHRLQRKSLVSDPDLHHCMCMTHMPWCKSGSPTPVAGKTFPTFPAHAQHTILRICTLKISVLNLNT